MKRHLLHILIPSYLQTVFQIPIQILQSHQPHPLLQDLVFPEDHLVVEVVEAAAEAGEKILLIINKTQLY